MADNVAITAGVGTSIATDQIGSDHYQLIKIAFGPLNTGTLVEATVGLPVNVLNSTVAVTQSGSWTFDTELPAVAALADNTANPTTTSVGAYMMVFDGTTWDRLLGNATDGALVNLGSNNDVTITSGTITTVTGVTTVATVTDCYIRGKTAHDAPVAVEPVLIAGYASAAAPTSVSADADTVRLWSLLNGSLVVNLSAAGALIGGDASNGLDCDVTRLIPGTGATNLGKAIDTATGATDTGVLALATRDDALSTLTPAEGDCVQLRTDANGALWVITSGTVTVGSHAVTNAGTFAVQVDGSALTSLQLLDDAVFVDDAAFTPATSKVLAIGFEADEGSTDSVDEGDIGAARMTLDRKQIVTLQPHTAGGTLIFRSLDLDAKEEVKATAGQVYGWYLFNAAATTHYVKFFNAAAADVTLGSTTPVLTIPIPAGAAANVAFPNGIAFSTGITVAATTGVADNDTGDPAANAIVVNIFYK